MVWKIFSTGENKITSGDKVPDVIPKVFDSKRPFDLNHYSTLENLTYQEIH